MFDEKNFNSVLKLIENSNLKIQNIKDVIEQHKEDNDIEKIDFDSLVSDIDALLKNKNYEQIDSLFKNLDTKITERISFLIKHYETLDKNLLRIQNVAKHIDKESIKDVENLAQIIETFLYKIKILQGIISDINTKINSFSGDNISVFLKALKVECNEFDEEFSQVLDELKKNFKKASELAEKLTQLDTNIEVQEELFSINVILNAVMSAIAVFDTKYKDLGKSLEESETYSEFKEKVDELASNTKSLSKNLKNFGSALEGKSVLNEQLENLNEKIDELKKALPDEYSEEFNGLKEQIETIDSKIQNIDKAISSQDFSSLEEIKDSTSKISEQIKNLERLDEKLDAVELSLKGSQAADFEGLKDQISLLDVKIDDVNSLVSNINTDEFSEIKTLVTSLDSTKQLAGLSELLEQVNSKENLSQEKLDEIKLSFADIDFSEIKEEINCVNNDLGILLDEIKNNRTFADRNYNNLKEVVEKINLNEIKTKLLEFDTVFKEGFTNTAKHDDIQHFIEGMDYIINKFEMLSNFIESCDEFFLIKEQFVGLDKKVIEIKKGIEKIDGAADLKKFINAHQEKLRILIEALDNTEKIIDIKNQSDVLISEASLTREIVENLEKVIKDIGFDEFQEAMVYLQKTINEVHADIKDIDEKVEDISIKNNVIEEKLSNIANKEDVASLEKTIKESNTNQLAKKDIENLEGFIKDTTVPLAHKDDITVLGEVLKEKNEQLEYLVRVLDNTDEISEIKQAILHTNNGEELEKLGQRLEELLANQKEARELLAQINTDQIQEAIENLSNEQKEVREIVSAKLDSNELKDTIEKVSKDQNDIKISLEQLGEIDYINEIKNISNLVEEKFENTDKDFQNINSRLQGILKQDDMEDTIKNIDDIQFAVKETLEEGSLIREDVSSLDNKVEELKSLLEFINNKKDFQDIKGIMKNIKEAQDDTKDVFSSLANVDDVAQLGSLINDNYHEIRLAFESLEPTKQAEELKKILDGFKKDQVTMNAVISDFEKNIDKKALGLIKEKMDANEAAIIEYIDKIQAKEEVQQVKNRIDSLAQDIVMQIMQVFENISFEQETQEIKDFIEESELNIKSVMSGLKASLERLLDAPQPIYIDELKTEVEKVAQGIVSLGDNIDTIGPEVSEYINTIESIKVSLEELSNTQNVVKVLEQEIGGLNVDIGEILKLLKDVSKQSELIYTLDDAEADFSKVSVLLEDILKNQHEQKESAKKDDIKGGIDNVNLSISHISENLNHFVSDYKCFADKVVDTVENLDGITSHISNIDSINSEYKKGVNESFKSLKSDLTIIATKVNYVSEDVDKISELSSQLIDFSAKNKSEIVKDIRDVKEIIDSSEIIKLQDNLSNIVFSLNNFMDNFEKKYSGIQIDTKELLTLSSEGKEICENIKGSMIYMAEWVNSSGKTFSTLQESINSFRAVFDERIQDLKSLDDIKNVLATLETTLAHQMDTTLAKQLQDKFEIELLPSIEKSLDTQLEEKLNAKFAQKEQEKEQERQELRLIINKQLSEETESLRDLVSMVEQKLINKLQAGVEQVYHKTVDFTPVAHRIESTEANINNNLQSSQKITTEGTLKAKEELSQELETYKTEMNSKFQNVSSQINLQMESLDKKIIDQDRKIESINDKLDTLITRLNKVQAMDLGEQVVALEGRMGSLDENIQKIVSFVEED